MQNKKKKKDIITDKVKFCTKALNKPKVIHFRIGNIKP